VVPREWHTYTAYGESFSSNRPFTTKVHSCERGPDRLLKFAERPLWDDAGWAQLVAISPLDCAEDIEIRGDRSGWGMRFPATADFWFDLEGRFCGYVPVPENQVLAEIDFLDCVLPYWLELNETPFLHASAVAWGGRAIAFSAFAGGGKSSLTTGLTLRGGGFVTDDVLVLRRTADRSYLALPGYPQLRLWEDAANRLLPSGSHEPIHTRWPKRRGMVDQWTWSTREPLPLAAIYLLDSASADERIEISPLGGQAGFFKLLDNLPALAALDFAAQARRTAFLADLLETVPVRRLKYPKSYAELDSVLDAVLTDLRSLP
jgi:hypothetical protein